MDKRVQRPGVRVGYDEWSETYDTTPNPLVALDRRYTMRLLRPRARERIDAALCALVGEHLTKPPPLMLAIVARKRR
jgi:hypothetical protein